MPDKRVDQQPSTTALFTALRRTLAHMEYGNQRYGPDSLAQVFLPLHFRFFLKFARIRASTKKNLAAAFPGMNEYVIARTAFFDQQFFQALQDRVSQIVLLGAGYDSRAYRFQGLNTGTRVFELDSASTQERKKKCLKSARLATPPWLSFVPVDFNREALGKVLEKAGWQRQPTLFLWEGVSYYLERRAVADTLAFVSQSGTGSRIVFDYTVPLSAENLAQVYGAAAFAEAMRSAHADEAILFAMEDSELNTFLGETRLNLLLHQDAGEIEKTYLMKPDGELIGRITGNFRFAVAAPP